MRAALISIVGQPRDTAGGAAGRIAGRSLAQRQLAFALAAGSEQIILLGDGSSREAIDLRHAAESAGAKVLTIRDGHGLLGVVRAADQLLVLGPGILPEAPVALEMLGKGSSLLVLPAAQGVAAGFERIDLERAWAGALVVQGGLVERLAELAPDSDPASALLRIALQAQVAERRLPEAVLADGSWAMVRSGEDMAAAERMWFKRNLPSVSRDRPAPWLAGLALRPVAARLLESESARPLVMAAAIALFVAAIGASACGWSTAGFALAGLGVLTRELAAGVAHLAEAPFADIRRSRFVSGASGALVDLTLVIVTSLAIDEDWLHRVFPPLVLFGLLRALRSEARAGAVALIGDRLLLALCLAFAAALGVTEPVVMALTVILIVIEVIEAAKTLESRG